MKILSTASEILAYSSENKLNGRAISFVPTMGALHYGHISLVEEAKRGNAKVVVSVFVNPTQFNEVSDLENYPRTFQADAEMLRNVGVDVMLYPSVDEVYPISETRSYDLDGLDDRMEGPNRPGHFNGVVQVVTRLFDMVNPDYAFFGEKDFQQLAIIRHMTAKLGYKTEIVGCSTIRAESGLALSSRNARLTDTGRSNASEIYKVLSEIRNRIMDGADLNEAVDFGKAELNKVDGLELEYLELVDPINLKLATMESKGIQACVAAWLEGVRLIDNMRVK